jgi:hypothetical protein
VRPTPTIVRPCATRSAVIALVALGCSASKHPHETSCFGPAITVDKVSWPQLPCDLCAAYGKPYASGSLVPDALGELSGLVASRAQPGILFAHNDSGSAPQVFVLASTGKELGRLCPIGGMNDDWEDIGIGPCPSGSCIYVGDIGDNHLARSNYGVYRVAEPSVSADAGALGSLEAEYFPFTYDDGPHNAEALVVHPESGRVYVIRKEAGTAPVFEVPIVSSGKDAPPATAARVGDIPMRSGEFVTGADISPCGNALLVRTNQGLLELRSPDAAPASVDALVLANAKDVPVATEIQGEAVTYVASGRGYITGSERASGPAIALQSVDCE